MLLITRFLSFPPQSLSGNFACIEFTTKLEANFIYHACRPNLNRRSSVLHSPLRLPIHVAPTGALHAQRYRHHLLFQPSGLGLCHSGWGDEGANY